MTIPRGAGHSADLRVVQFPDLDAFLQVLQPHDDSFLNFVYGALLDSRDPSRTGKWKGVLPFYTLLAVYRGDELL